MRPPNRQPSPETDAINTTAADCTVYLPYWYPLPRCPWHMDLKTTLVMAAARLFFLAAGYCATTARDAWHRARDA